MYGAVPAQALAGFHPCVVCFEALLRHMEGGCGGRQIGQEFSEKFPGEPPVGFFVRWEVLDRDLRRYIPRGFMGSFTPKPFRPALAEYAVNAASADPKFWPLSWAELPDTRCRVVIVRGLEAAQDTRDWAANLHGLVISFKDSAGRRYQGALFPETVKKARWTKAQALEALFQRAGYWGKTGGGLGMDPAVVRSLSVSRFQTTAMRMSFGKFRRLKRHLRMAA